MNKIFILILTNKINLISKKSKINIKNNLKNVLIQTILIASKC